MYDLVKINYLIMETLGLARADDSIIQAFMALSNEIVRVENPWVKIRLDDEELTLNELYDCIEWGSEEEIDEIELPLEERLVSIDREVEEYLIIQRFFVAWMEWSKSFPCPP
jgi:hypothetical protein